MAKSTTSPSAAKSTELADSSSQPASQLPLPATYEAGLQELESLVSGLESGQLPLDELLTAYRRGAQIMAFCRSRLEEVENQVKVLDGNELKTWAPPER